MRVTVDLLNAIRCQRFLHVCSNLGMQSCMAKDGLVSKPVSYLQPLVITAFQALLQKLNLADPTYLKSVPEQFSSIQSTIGQKSWSEVLLAMVTEGFQLATFVEKNDPVQYDIGLARLRTGLVASASTRAWPALLAGVGLTEAIQD